MRIVPRLIHQRPVYKRLQNRVFRRFLWLNVVIAAALPTWLPYTSEAFSWWWPLVILVPALSFIGLGRRQLGERSIQIAMLYSGIYWGMLIAFSGGELLPLAILGLSIVALAGILFSHLWSAFLSFFVPLWLIGFLGRWIHQPDEIFPLTQYSGLLMLTVALVWYAHLQQAKLMLVRDHLRQNNRALSHEVALRIQAEKVVHQINDQLEDMVRLRTDDLSQALQKLEQKDQELQLALSSNQTMVWQWDIAARKLTITEDVLDLEHALGGDLTTLIHPEDFPKVKAALISHLRGQTHQYRVTYRILHPDSGRLWVEDLGVVTQRNERKLPLRMLGTRRNVTAEVEHRRQLEMSNNYFNRVQDAIMILDKDGTIEACNDAYLSLRGLASDWVLGLHWQHVIEDKRFARIWESVLQEGEWQGEMQERSFVGKNIPLSVAIQRFDDPGVGESFLFIAQRLDHILDMDERPLGEDYDRLTGLPGKSSLQQTLKELQELPHFPQNLYMAEVNIDRLQPVNKSLGYPVGDQVIQDFAMRLRATRLINVQSLVRLGGDRFALLFQENSDEDKLKNQVVGLLDELNRPVFIDDHELALTASIGVLHLKKEALELALKYAREALNEAQLQGGNRINWHQESWGRRTQISAEELEFSLKHEQLFLDFQPQIDLLNGSVFGVEVFVRWDHPRHGLISGQQIVEVAEQSGQIGRLNAYVMRHSCEEINTWYKRGFHRIRLSINISDQQFLDNELWQTTALILRETGLPAEALILEVSESVLMKDLPRAKEQLSRFAELGVQVILDDFGIGSTSLQELQRLPVSAIKVDRSFVLGMVDNEQKRALAKNIITLGHNLGIQVLAEGVETLRQMELLQEFGCDLAQGYFISRPLPASEALHFVMTQNYQMNSLSGEVH